MGNIFLSILGISVSIGLIVIGLIFLTPFLNKRYAAKWKYLIWIFLALRLLIPFSGANGQDVMDRMSQLKVGTNSESEENEEKNQSSIVKRKNISMKPMDEEEAILQIELLNHDFFVFKNIDEECVSVLYNRKDGNYGIINMK